ncbi:MAG: hypothetical protein GOVbin2937_40 [Prokaryotic dsDNA virus sp.]|nr:MAG: hypothetical protein GOVbin2937_40 [Prokaryotic dsDNA virus sp.]
MTKAVKELDVSGFTKAAEAFKELGRVLNDMPEDTKQHLRGR